MRSLFSLILIAFFNLATAQKIVDVNKQTGTIGSDVFFNVNGVPFVNAKFVSLVEGTPYFKAEWMKAKITMPAGKEYKDISVKIDLFDNEFHFLNDKDVELVATSPVKEILLTDSRGTYRFIHTSAIPQSSDPVKKTWYHLLVEGPTSLYKTYNKILSESKPYGSATTEQRIHTKENYLVYSNNTFLEIKKIKDAADVLANRKKEIEEFLKTKDDKNQSMDDRFIALINYYNSLVKQ